MVQESKADIHVNSAKLWMLQVSILLTKNKVIEIVNVDDLLKAKDVRKDTHKIWSLFTFCLS
jgi:hypothetical protein